MLRTYFKLSFVLLAVMLPMLGFGQSATVSPYSRYGIGELQNQTGVQGFSMGRTGIAMHNDSLTPFFINLKNPASFAYNHITTFEAGVLNNNVTFTSMGQSKSNNNAYFGYFAVAFPMGKKMGGCLGLSPLSSVGYNINTSSGLDSIAPSGQHYTIDNVNNTYIGDGGLNKIFGSVAYAPSKHISMGVTGSYIFGNITNSQLLFYNSNYTTYSSERVLNTHVKDLYADYGVMLSAGRDSGWHACLGLTAGLGTHLNADYNLLAVNYMNGLIYDTIQDSSARGSIRLPVSLGAGITIKKGDKWTFTFDYLMQNWSNYTYFGQKQGLSNSTQMGFGMQYVPKRVTETRNWFKKMNYRAGFSYSQSYLDINNSQLTDYCITLGVALPVSQYPPYSIADRLFVANIGIQLGQLGTTANNLMQEKYFKVLFSFTFDDHWFVKREFQ